MGRSRGGFSPKVHAITEALGNPLDFVLTGGPAESRLDLVPEGTQMLVGDKGYDSDGLIHAIQAREMEAVIPLGRHRTETREYDWLVYKERHLIDGFFNKIKHYLGIFSRSENIARNSMGFLRVVSALIWLR